MKITFELDEQEEWPEEEALSFGFSMGNLEVCADGITTSSKAQGGRHLMMIYLALADILNGVRTFCDRESRSYEFVGADSSFVLWFHRKKGGLVEVRHLGSIVAVVDEQELTAALYEGAAAFWSLEGKRLGHNDPVRSDVVNALTKFREWCGPNSMRPKTYESPCD